MNPDQRQFVISILARDRIGIVADVSGAIAALDGDIADLRQSVLRGYFTMILLATFPARLSAEEIRSRIASAPGDGGEGLEVIVHPADDAIPAVPGIAPDHTYLLTVRGADRIGIVANVSAFCARNGLNILDLATTVDKGQYVMMLLVDVSACSDLDGLRSRLAAFGAQAGLEAVLQHEAIFRATNEVDP